MRNYFTGKFAIFVRGDDVLLDESGLRTYVAASWIGQWCIELRDIVSTDLYGGKTFGMVQTKVVSCICDLLYPFLYS